MVKIKDVAREANVSIALVSRILNNDKKLSVPDETRNRVFTIAEKIKYKPNRKRNVKQKVNEAVKTKNIGLLLSVSQQEEFNDPYFLSIREGIEKQAADLGINISNVIRLNGNRSKIDPIDLDGLIVVGNIDSDDLRAISFQANNIVFVNHSPKNGEFDSVVTNLGKATENILEYLFQLGHENIGFIGGREFSRKIASSAAVETEEERQKVYERVMKERRIFNPRNVFMGDWTSTDGYELMRKAIDAGNLPSAFVIASDPMAIGALRALNESNIKIPESVAVVSVDDIEAAAYLHPPLTTIRVYTEQMGRTAVNVLVERFNGRDIPIQVVLPTKLIVRESCGGNANEHWNYIL